MNKKINLGIIGLSEGNGHPYSWSAIFNGYDKKKMESCGYPTIPIYLKEQKFPDAQIKEGKVTHVWTQDLNLSKHIAAAALIENIATDYNELVENVDAVLLARDDAENHYEMAKVFIENGIPIFIDKPLAYNIKEAEKIYSINENSLIYTCSSIRFAKEFSETIIEGINFVNATIMKSWEKYGIHIIEPVVSMFPNRGNLLSVEKIDSSIGVKIRVVKWRNLQAVFTTTGEIQSQLQIDIMNVNSVKTLLFKDTFYAFRESLRNFIKVTENKKANIDKSETLEIIEIIEKGI